jgi:toxin FitB
VIALDSSVVVAAVLPWHEAHGEAVAHVNEAVVPAHAALEAYSVMTRLPNPLAPEVAGRLVGQFRVIDTVEDGELVARCAQLGLTGGSVYDALIAWTANHHGLGLASRDQRAARVYDLIGVPVTWV